MRSRLSSVLKSAASNSATLPGITRKSERCLLLQPQIRAVLTGCSDERRPGSAAFARFREPSFATDQAAHAYAQARRAAFRAVPGVRAGCETGGRTQRAWVCFAGLGAAGGLGDAGLSAAD